MRFAVALVIAAVLGFGVPLSAYADSHTSKPAAEQPTEAPPEVSAPPEPPTKAPPEVSTPPEQPAEGEKAAAEGEEKPDEGKAEKTSETQPE